MLFGAILLFVSGVVFLIYAIKRKKDASDSWYVDARGYLGGSVAIIGGLIYIIEYFLK